LTLDDSSVSLNSQKELFVNYQDSFYFIKEIHSTCTTCGLTFQTNSDYMLHLKSEHSIQVFQCALCQQVHVFNSLSLLKDHFLRVHQSRQIDLFKCRICLNSPQRDLDHFNHIDDLYQHLNTFHNIK
jgi:transcription elongation factor Elf1